MFEPSAIPTTKDGIYVYNQHTHTHTGINRGKHDLKFQIYRNQQTSQVGQLKYLTGRSHMESIRIHEWRKGFRCQVYVSSTRDLLIFCGFNSWWQRMTGRIMDLQGPCLSIRDKVESQELSWTHQRTLTAGKPIPDDQVPHGDDPHSISEVIGLPPVIIHFLKYIP